MRVCAIKCVFLNSLVTLRTVETSHDQSNKQLVVLSLVYYKLHHRVLALALSVAVMVATVTALIAKLYGYQMIHSV